LKEIPKGEKSMTSQQNSNSYKKKKKNYPVQIGTVFIEE